MAADPTSIAIIGASSPLGQTILSLLSTQSSYNITVLTRSSSKASFPPSTNVLKGDYTHSFLTTSFRGVHAVISLISPSAIASQTDIIDAAISAGVKRFFPSEFSADTADPLVIDLIPFYEAKVKIVKYLRKKQEETKGEFRWTAMIPGVWLDLCLSTGEMGFDLSKKTAMIFDGGTMEMDCTSLQGVANAVLGCLELERQGKGDKLDGYVYVKGLRTNQNEILEVLKKVGKGDWSFNTGNGYKRKEEGWKRFNDGDFEGVVDVIWGVAYETGLGGKFMKERKLMNEEIGLEDEELEDVVRRAMERS